MANDFFRYKVILMKLKARRQSIIQSFQFPRKRGGIIH